MQIDLISRFAKLVQHSNILAPASFWDLTDDQLAEYGCGPGKMGDWFVPDSLWGQDILVPCQNHDHMYEEGGTKEDKIFADLLFLINMVAVIVEKDEFLDDSRLDWAMKYYRAVHGLGGDCFGDKDLNKEMLWTG